MRLGLTRRHRIISILVMQKILPLVFSLLASQSWLAAAQDFVPPEGGTALVPADFIQQLYLTNTPKLGAKTNVTISGQTFGQAVEINTLQRPPNPWDFQLVRNIPGTLRKGDVFWITLWMRATQTSSESQSAYAQVCVEENGPPYDKIGMYDFSAGREWQQFAWVFVADRDYPDGKANFCLRLGYSPQTVQLGGLQIINYGQSVKPENLPRIKLGYDGIEPDAPWRKAAAARIEQHRKADLKISVMDVNGQPLPNATVKIEQLRHQFGFGSCVTAALLTGNDANSERYREIVKNSYSKVVLENDLKWPPWEHGAKDGHKTTLAALRWLREQNIQVRGHTLIWPSWAHVPKRLQEFKNNPAELARQIETHIRDITGAIKGLLSEWDVVNEPYANHELLDLLPPDTMVSWFKLAKESDPEPVLYLNDYAGFMERGENTPHKDAFEKKLRELQQQGAPIGGLGIQAHFDQQFAAPEALLQELDRWAKLGLEIQITEFDLNLNEYDAEIQAQYTRDFMTAVFSHPAVSALLMWVFWEGAHWRPHAALYRKDWSLKPNGQAWNDLVLNEWRSNLTASTGANGAVNTRVFKGDYQITVTHDGQEKKRTLTVSRETLCDFVLP